MFIEEDANEVESRSEYSDEEEETSEVPEVARIEMWHLTHPGMLREIVQDMHHFLYVTDDWSPEFYVKQAYEGFVAVCYEDRFLLPEMQRSYAMIDLTLANPLHLGKSLRKKLRRHPQELLLTFNTSLEAVLRGIQQHHGGQNWLQTTYGKLASVLLSRGDIQASTDSNFRFLSVELWSGAELVAGEVGYAIGRVYTSLTGFRLSQGEQPVPRLAFGSVQMLALGRLLKQAGFTLWNLGHPPRGKVMRYKTELGAQVLPRGEFLELWRQARVGDATAVNYLMFKSDPVITAQVLLSAY